MSKQFNMSQPFADGSVKVTGADPGEVVKLYPHDWTTFKKAQAERDALESANAEYEQAVNDTFANIIEVAKKLESTLAGINQPDPNRYVTVREATEGVKAKKEIVVELDVHSQIVRLIENGETDRLEWTVYADHAEIDILAYEVPVTLADDVRLVCDDAPDTSDTLAVVLGEVDPDSLR